MLQTSLSAPFKYRMYSNMVTLFQTVPGTCRPVHEVQFSRNAVITGHATINVGQHLHAEIGISNASDIH